MTERQKILDLNLDKVMLDGWRWQTKIESNQNADLPHPTRHGWSAMFLCEDTLERATLTVLQDCDEIYDLDGNMLLIVEAHMSCAEDHIPPRFPVCRWIDENPTCLSIINEQDEELLIIGPVDARGLYVAWLDEQ